MQRLGEVASLYQVREPLQELTDVDGRAMQIEKPLCKDSDCDDAASQNRPHQQATLLDVIDHLELS